MLHPGSAVTFDEPVVLRPAPSVGEHPSEILGCELDAHQAIAQAGRSTADDDDGGGCNGATSRCRRSSSRSSEVFATLSEHECPTTRVRDAEPLGFDADLWRVLTETGVVSMALPSTAGGDGETLVENLALVAEAFGRALAPVPLIDAVVAARLIAVTGGSEVLALDREQVRRTATVALHPSASGSRQLVSSGAIADVVVGLVDDEVVLYEEATRRSPCANLGSTPLAWRELSGTRRAPDRAGGRPLVHAPASNARGARMEGTHRRRANRSCCRCAPLAARLCEGANGVRRADRDLSGDLASPGRRRSGRRGQSAACSDGRPGGWSTRPTKHCRRYSWRSFTPAKWLSDQRASASTSKADSGSRSSRTCSLQLPSRAGGRSWPAIPTRTCSAWVTHLYRDDAGS